MKKLSLVIAYGPHAEGIEIEARGIISFMSKEKYDVQAVFLTDDPLKAGLGPKIVKLAHRVGDTELYPDAVFVLNGASQQVAWHMGRLYHSITCHNAEVIELKFAGEYDVIAKKELL